MDLSTNYNGIKIKNPIIVGSSGLSNTVEKNINIEKNNAGAIVLKSLFEEQIVNDIKKEYAYANNTYTEAFDYIKNYVKEESISNYIKIIEDSKKAVNIPIIASINCVTADAWTDFAEKIEDAGADALELNISNIPTDVIKTGNDYEQRYFDVIEKISSKIKMPISLKMNYYSAGLSNLIQKIDWTNKIKSIILFNRFYSPDIDIDNLKIISTNSFSTENEYSMPLRWIAVMYGKINSELIASTGVHSGESIMKLILAGANAVQVVSALYKNDISYINTLLEELKNLMKKKNYTKINDFKGKMSYSTLEDPSSFERIQFMKYYGGIS